MAGPSTEIPVVIERDKDPGPSKRVSHFPGDTSARDSHVQPTRTNEQHSSKGFLAE